MFERGAKSHRCLIRYRMEYLNLGTVYETELLVGLFTMDVFRKCIPTLCDCESDGLYILSCKGSEIVFVGRNANIFLVVVQVRTGKMALKFLFDVR